MPLSRCATRNSLQHHCGSVADGLDWDFASPRQRLGGERQLMTSFKGQFPSALRLSASIANCALRQHIRQPRATLCPNRLTTTDQRHHRSLVNQGRPLTALVLPTA